MKPIHQRTRAKAVAFFALRFLALTALFSTLAYLDTIWLESAVERALAQGFVVASAGGLSLAGVDVEVWHNQIFYEGSRFGIIRECTSMEVLGMYGAAVLAYPTSWRNRARGLALGLALLVINLFRILTLILGGAQSAVVLDLGHLYVWPAILLGITIALWFSWAGTVEDAPDLLARS